MNSLKPYIDEFTVFIKVSIANLNELSISMPLIVNKAHKNKREITNIIIDKKCAKRGRKAAVKPAEVNTDLLICGDSAVVLTAAP